MFKKPWEGNMLIIAIVFFSVSYNFVKFFELRIDLVVNIQTRKSLQIVYPKYCRIQSYIQEYQTTAHGQVKSLR